MTDRTSLSVLVVTNEFPSTIQPWLLSQVEYLVRNNVGVTILAETVHAGPVPPIVRELGLLEKTHYIPATSHRHIAVGLAGLVWPLGNRLFLTRWRGVLRLLRHRGWSPQGFGGWIKALIRAQLLPQLKVSIVHAHGMVNAHDSILFAEILDIPLLYTFHGLTPKGVRPLAAPKRMELFESAAGFLVNTRFAMGQLLDLGCPEEKIRIIPQGTDVKRFAFRSRHGVVGDTVTVLMVGRLHPDKGHQYAFRGIKNLIDLGRDLQLRVVGIGPLEEELRMLAGELGILDRTKFLAAVDEWVLVREYQAADIVLFPSVTDPTGEYHTETQGVVVQEAQSCGALVVASNVGGIPECVSDGENAFLVPERDPQSIADTIEWLISHREKWAGWSDSARRWVETRFSMEVVGQKHSASYRELIDQHGSRRTKSARRGGAGL